MEKFFTKDAIWLSKWDDFLFSENRGNHLLYSDWLKSYQSYGFDFEVYIVLENNKIIGGFGAVIAKSLIFRFYIVPIGPIFSFGLENEARLATQEIIKRAKKLNCCYTQYKLPVVPDLSGFNHAYQSNNINFEDNKFKNGNFFKYIYSSNGFNWIDFSGLDTSNDLLEKFTVQVRRNIKLSQKNNPEITFAKTIDECQLAYKIIQENANQNNYSVRSFNDFGTTIISLINKRKAFFMVAKINNEIKGSAFVVNCGKHLTYITGGTAKEKPDLKIGYLLHWKIIEMSFELGFSGYNISLGGSKGVVDFKSKFDANSILFIENAKYFVLKPIYFNLYLSLDKILKKNKKIASKVLKFLK